MHRILSAASASGSQVSSRRTATTAKIANSVDRVFTALKQKNADETKRLIDKYGIDPNQTNNEGESLLLAAIHAKTRSGTQLLLNRGAKAALRDSGTGETPLAVAAEAGRASLIAMLVKAAVNQGFSNIVNIADKQDRTPLRKAARAGQTEVVQELLQIKGIEVDRACKDGITPLLAAAGSNCPEIVAMLLDANGDPRKAGPTGSTVIMRLARMGHEKLLDSALTLIEKKFGYDEMLRVLDLADEDQNTALTAAAKSGHLPCVRLLLAILAQPLEKVKSAFVLIRLGRCSLPA